MSKLNFTQLFRILQRIRASCVQNPQSTTFCNPRTAWLDVLTTEILPSVRRNHQPATRICPACLVKWDLSRNTGFAYWPEWIPIPRGNKVFCSMGRGFIMIYHDLSNLYQIITITINYPLFMIVITILSTRKLLHSLYMEVSWNIRLPQTIGFSHW